MRPFAETDQFNIRGIMERIKQRTVRESQAYDLAPPSPIQEGALPDRKKIRLDRSGKTQAMFAALDKVPQFVR